MFDQEGFVYPVTTLQQMGRIVKGAESEVTLTNTDQL